MMMLAAIKGFEQSHEKMIVVFKGNYSGMILLGELEGEDGLGRLMRGRGPGC